MKIQSNLGLINKSNPKYRWPWDDAPPKGEKKPPKKAKKKESQQ